MEKENGSKEVKMQTNNRQSQKLSYEELNQACAEMSQQIQQQNKYIQQLRGQIQEMNYLFQNKRMDYLFRAVKIAGKSSASEYACFSKDFIEECIGEIQESLTIPQEEDRKETSKEN